MGGCGARRPVFVVAEEKKCRAAALPWCRLEVAVRRATATATARAIIIVQVVFDLIILPSAVLCCSVYWYGAELLSFFLQSRKLNHLEIFARSFC